MRKDREDFLENGEPDSEFAKDIEAIDVAIEALEETAELKRLLKIAVEDLALCTRSCIGINCDHCHFTSNLEECGCKWKHAEEALKLIGDEDNV